MPRTRPRFAPRNGSARGSERRGVARADVAGRDPRGNLCGFERSDAWVGASMRPQNFATDRQFTIDRQPSSALLARSERFVVTRTETDEAGERDVVTLRSRAGAVGIDRAGKLSLEIEKPGALTRAARVR